MWTIRLLGCALVLVVVGRALADDLQTAWQHIYHQPRLQIIQLKAYADGVIVDASHGKNKDGARHEADGDGHFWLKLDPGQGRLLNQKNLDEQEGNLVFEVICRYKVTQADAQQACKDYKSTLEVPPVGSHVRVYGSYVLDTQHGHTELHPVIAVIILPSKPPDGESDAEDAMTVTLEGVTVSTLTIADPLELIAVGGRIYTLKRWMALHDPCVGQCGKTSHNPCIDRCQSRQNCPAVD